MKSYISSKKVNIYLLYLMPFNVHHLLPCKHRQWYNLTFGSFKNTMPSPRWPNWGRSSPSLCSRSLSPPDPQPSQNHFHTVCGQLDGPSLMSGWSLWCRVFLRTCCGIGSQILGIPLWWVGIWSANYCSSTPPLWNKMYFRWGTAFHSSIHATSRSYLV